MESGTLNVAGIAVCSTRYNTINWWNIFRKLESRLKCTQEIWKCDAGKLQNTNWCTIGQYNSTLSWVSKGKIQVVYQKTTEFPRSQSLTQGVNIIPFTCNGERNMPVCLSVWEINHQTPKVPPFPCESLEVICINGKGLYYGGTP